MKQVQTPQQIDQKERYIGKIALGAAQTAILFYPVFLLCNLIAWCSDTAVPLWVIAIASFIHGMALFSDTIVQALTKWIFSIPLTFGFWYYFGKIRFYFRALNWVFPGYGDQSAGGSMATAFLLAVMAFFFFLTGITSILCSCILKPPKTFSIIQHIVCTTTCIGIVITILILDSIMPQYLYFNS